MGDFSRSAEVQSGVNVAGERYFCEAPFWRDFAGLPVPAAAVAPFPKSLRYRYGCQSRRHNLNGRSVVLRANSKFPLSSCNHSLFCIHPTFPCINSKAPVLGRSSEARGTSVRPRSGAAQRMRPDRPVVLLRVGWPSEAGGRDWAGLQASGRHLQQPFSDATPQISLRGTQPPVEAQPVYLVPALPRPLENRACPPWAANQLGLARLLV